MRALLQISLAQFLIRYCSEQSRLQLGDDRQISYFFILISLILFVKLTMESSGSINERKNDLQVLLEKQDTSDPNGKRRVGPAKLPCNSNKKRIISPDNDSLSLFAPSEVEEELQ